MEADGFQKQMLLGVLHDYFSGILAIVIPFETLDFFDTAAPARRLTNGSRCR